MPRRRLLAHFVHGLVKHRPELAIVVETQSAAGETWLAKSRGG